MEACKGRNGKYAFEMKANTRTMLVDTEERKVRIGTLKKIVKVLWRKEEEIVQHIVYLSVVSYRAQRKCIRNSRAAFLDICSYMC